jgi:hypothetical protein
MTWLLTLSLVGIAVALLRGGSFAGWARAHVYWSWVALGSLGLQLVLYDPPIDRLPWVITWGPVVWTLCLAALFAVLVRNAIATPTLKGAWALAAVGVGLNVLVVAANGGYMPQSDEAHLATRGVLQASAPAADPQLRNVLSMSSETRLNWLGDIIPEPAWLPRNNVISIGDVLLGSGLAWWVFLITASSPRRVARVVRVVRGARPGVDMELLLEEAASPNRLLAAA